MKKAAFILTMTIFILTAFTANGIYAKEFSSAPAYTSIFEPGETVFVEIPGFDLAEIPGIRSAITSPDVGAEWMGYCESWKVICVKIPPSGQLTLETALKQVTGGYTLKSTSSVTYSIADSCFIIE